MMIQFVIITFALASVTMSVCEARQCQPPRYKGDWETTSDNAFVTLTTTNEWVPLAATLGKSLQRSNSNADMVALITSDVSEENRNKLEKVGWKLRLVERLPLHCFPPNLLQKEGLDPVRRARIPEVFTKLNMWDMVEYKKVVFLDADAFVPHPEDNNVDELFEWPQFSASPHFEKKMKASTASQFNSGVVVLSPSAETFEKMMHSVTHHSEGDWIDQCLYCGDQDFLSYFFTHEDLCGENNKYQTDKQLPFEFNWRSEQAKVANVPVQKAKVIHVKGVNKRGALLSNCNKDRDQWEPEYLRGARGDYLHAFCDAYQLANPDELLDTSVYNKQHEAISQHRRGAEHVQIKLEKKAHSGEKHTHMHDPAQPPKSEYKAPMIFL